MDIKEIALKVGLQAFEEHPYDKGHVVSPSGYTWIDDKLIEFAEALVAELAKQNEPVESQYKGSDGSWKSFDSKDHESNTRNSGDWEVRDLFTYPPTAEQIANETAWQPIETAPKDGLIYIWITGINKHGQKWSNTEGECWPYCYYDNICGEWRTTRPSGHLRCVPERFVTHWMPLPTPPKRSMEGV